MIHRMMVLWHGYHDGEPDWTCVCYDSKILYDSAADREWPVSNQWLGWALCRVAMDDWDSPDKDTHRPPSPGLWVIEADDPISDESDEEVERKPFYWPSLSWRRLTNSEAISFASGVTPWGVGHYFVDDEAVQ